ncbi:MAG TPA: nucleotide exchange factor GrpE [Bacteroidales bacterium]|nr:nucleotide exchange factor GrpE [Bacteroidales bacterium]
MKKQKKQTQKNDITENLTNQKNDTTENNQQTISDTKTEELKTKEQPKESNKTDQTKDNEIELLKNNVAELNNKYLRLLAEYDNYRKRTMKEKAELMKTATAELLINLLPITDDFERAIQSTSQSSDIQSVIEGVKLIQQKFINFLTKNGIEEIKSIGEKFNTDLHEAINVKQSENEEQKDTIVEEIQKGYTLHGKVLRHAKVIVAK